MKYVIKYENVLAQKVSINYFANSVYSLHENLQTKEMSREGNLWMIEIDMDCNLVYKFTIDEEIYMNDPFAQKYICLNSYDYWSFVKDKQNIKSKSIAKIDSLLICKNLDNNYNPIGITKKITSLDEKIVCWCELSNFTCDSLITMIWRDSKQNLFSSIEILTEYDNRNVRKVFTGIEIKDIINSKDLYGGNWNVQIFLNGILSGETNFIVSKFSTYSNGGRLI